ncbi:MAG: hypothetical protein AB1540_03615 [Bdellovibrionota bacterium]
MRAPLPIAAFLTIAFGCLIAVKFAPRKSTPLPASPSRSNPIEISDGDFIDQDGNLTVDRKARPHAS